MTLAGCSSGGGDNPALDESGTTVPIGVSAGKPGPKVTFAQVSGIPVPELTGHGSANSGLRSVSSHLHGTCKVTTLRDDPNLASFIWNCGSAGVATATYELSNDKRLSLSDLLKGGYASYLSSTATAQLEANGATNPNTSNLSLWALTPYTLEVVFSAGTVSFPLDSLGAYVKRSGPLSA